MTITEFLEARISEDEAVARAGAWQDYGWEAREDAVWETMSFGADCIVRCDEPEEAAHIARHDPARVLAECAAKRAIIKGLEPFSTLDDINAPELLSILAAVYADHPEYRQEWALKEGEGA